MSFTHALEQLKSLSPMTFFAVLFFSVSGLLLLIKRVFYGRKVRAEVVHILLIFIFAWCANYYVQYGGNPIAGIFDEVVNAIELISP